MWFLFPLQCPRAGLGQSDVGLRTQLDVQIEWSTLRPQYFSTSASLVRAASACLLNSIFVYLLFVMLVR